MPYIHLNKSTNKYTLFGSIPVMCKTHGLDKESMEYKFSRKKLEQFETDDYLIVRVELQRGGK